MKAYSIAVAALLICLGAGCATSVRSISQSGYLREDRYCAPSVRELDEFEVLGLDRTKPASEDDIQRALREAKPIRLTPGSTILLVQSGAIFPDGVMVSELSKTFRVVPFTGVSPEPMPPEQHDRRSPSNRSSILAAGREVYQTPPPAADPGAYSRLLRLAAARAGASVVVCYWGILESGRENLGTKTITWIPAVNWLVPDERQHMRISLKVAVVDVASGSWSVFSVQPPDMRTITRNPKREAADQKLVEALKEKAYELAARDLAMATR